MNDLEAIKRLMHKRDIGSMGIMSERSDLLALADEVPGLVAELEQLRVELDAIKAKCVVGGRVGDNLVVFPEGSYITAQVERDGLRAEVEAVTQKNKLLEEEGEKLIESQRLRAEAAEAALNVAELQISAIRAETKCNCAEIPTDALRHFAGCPWQFLVIKALHAAEKPKGDPTVAGYGEVCQGCGKLVRISCACVEKRNDEKPLPPGTVRDGDGNLHTGRYS